MFYSLKYQFSPLEVITEIKLSEEIIYQVTVKKMWITHWT